MPKLTVNAERLRGLALIPVVFETPDQFAANPKETRAKWSAFIRRINLVAPE